MHRRLAPLLLLVVGTLGCGGDPPWVGSWQVTSTWDVRGPFGAGRSVGDAVADIVIGEIVGLTPVPSFLEDDLFELLQGFAAADIVAMVDAAAPAELGPEGEVTLLLSSSLAAVRTTSELELDEATFSDLEGEETITSMELDIAGLPRALPPGNLFDTASAEMRAEWSGDESGATRLKIEPHTVPIQYGALVAEILLFTLDAAGLDALRTGVLAALDCGTLVGLILDGEPGLDVTLSDWTYTIPASDFTAACQAAQGAMGGRVLGLFSSDAAVVVGGELDWSAAALTTPTGFDGILAVAPESVAPRISAQLTARR